MVFQVKLLFTMGQHSRDSELMKSLVTYLDCGRYYSPSGSDHVDFSVSKLLDNTEKIVPFFDKYPLTGEKSLDYADFCKAGAIVKAKGHLTVEGLKEICKIKSGMNRRRY